MRQRHYGQQAVDICSVKWSHELKYGHARLKRVAHTGSRSHFAARFPSPPDAPSQPPPKSATWRRNAGRAGAAIPAPHCQSSTVAGRPRERSASARQRSSLDAGGFSRLTGRCRRPPIPVFQPRHDAAKIDMQRAQRAGRRCDDVMPR